MATYEYAVVAVGRLARRGDPESVRITVDQLAAVLNDYGGEGFDVAATVQTVEQGLANTDVPIGVVILRRPH